MTGWLHCRRCDAHLPTLYVVRRPNGPPSALCGPCLLALCALPSGSIVTKHPVSPGTD